ncbi:hypothetical protein COLO4_35633 [Corchorus olitorius]|uniref:Uncharacterized protein n=1 Tax=Corchorus olitorius TaxID=93759 RepID=A0A1R3GEK5_9ROSI|nr:hypothetical protein COLO4_35633 [Corchorus olitorius]
MALKAGLDSAVAASCSTDEQSNLNAIMKPKTSHWKWNE